jgi:hypothetical protein
MGAGDHKNDFFYLVLLVLLMAALPLGIRVYDRYRGLRDLPPGTKEFILTGSACQGWVLGELKAHSIISLWQQPAAVNHPVIQGVILLAGLYLGLSRGRLAVAEIIEAPGAQRRVMLLPAVFALGVVNIFLRLYLG